MNPIYVLIYWALETHSSGRRPLTPEPNKEITCFLIHLTIFQGASTKESLILKATDEAKNTGYIMFRLFLSFSTFIKHLFYARGVNH